jgi:hypothetical protein
MYMDLFYVARAVIRANGKKECEKEAFENEMWDVASYVQLRCTCTIDTFLDSCSAIRKR